ncbi:hypothetical protein [Pelagibacterium luteolum]|uniref:Uncharacterized protein n=1 Tax=Pelagibacterium luteolum TaxID=440168 RepID=A0A1G7TSI3_9HYPH|nr:hypothetical protein [Pelagibacterium luteolum]SDG37944.1 hypothetical protein SAMN04487974_102301 [Pelagibacterium luteolum]
MGMLLKFSPKATTYIPGSPNRSGSAEVILFTGVRYERAASEVITKPGHKIKKRRKG